MTRYLARKFVLYLLTFFVAVTIDWAIPRFMPGDPVQGLIARLRADSTASQELDGVLHEVLRARPAALAAVPRLLARRSSTATSASSITYVGSSVSDLIWAAVPYTLALLVPAIVLSYIAGNRRRRARRPAQGARQHRPADRLHPHGDALHVARDHARLRPRVQVRASSRSPGAYDFSLQPEWSWEFVEELPRPLVPPVPLALPRRVRRLGDRDAQPDHLRARGRLRELPAVARRAAGARPRATPTATRSCRRSPASRSRSERSSAARS